MSDQASENDVTEFAELNGADYSELHAASKEAQSAHLKMWDDFQNMRRADMPDGKLDETGFAREKKQLDEMIDFDSKNFGTLSEQVRIDLDSLIGNYEFTKRYEDSANTATKLIDMQSRLLTLGAKDASEFDVDYYHVRAWGDYIQAGQFDKAEPLVRQSIEYEQKKWLKDPIERNAMDLAISRLCLVKCIAKDDKLGFIEDSGILSPVKQLTLGEKEREEIKDQLTKAIDELKKSGRKDSGVTAYADGGGDDVKWALATIKAAEGSRDLVREMRHDQIEELKKSVTYSEEELREKKAQLKHLQEVYSKDN